MSRPTNPKPSREVCLRKRPKVINKKWKRKVRFIRFTKITTFGVKNDQREEYPKGIRIDVTRYIGVSSFKELME